MSVSHLHTPKINRMAVYDTRTFNSLENFLDGDDCDAPVKFIPIGNYTMSVTAYMRPSIHNVIIGGGPPVMGRDGYTWDGGYTPDGINYGFTSIYTTNGDTAIEQNETASMLARNAITLRDLTFINDINTLSVYTGAVQSLRTHYMSIENCAFINIEGGGHAIRLTGTSEVNLQNVIEQNFGGTATVAAAGANYFRLCNDIRIDGLTFNADNKNISTVFFLYDCTRVRMQDVRATSVNSGPIPSYFLTYTGSSAYNSKIDIDGLEMDYCFFTSSQRGFFSVEAPYCNVDVRGLVLRDYANTVSCESDNANVGKVHLHGTVGRESTDLDIPTGYISTFIDGDRKLFAPRSYASVSTITASTNYTVSCRPLHMFVIGGTGVVMTISSAARTYVTAGTSFMLDPGTVVNFGAYTVAPTVSAYFLED